MRPNGPLLPRLTAVLLGLAAASSPAAARELHWRAVDVRARLDSGGALHVVERQTMVFTGDWNGGERIFRILPGQSLALEALARVGPDGQKHPLAAGDLSAVDQYAWKDARTLRWRSRLPSDPAFDRTEIVYEIAYTLSGILVREGSGYLLDHDFIFPDRSGSIEKFTLSLELDSAWRPARPVPASFARGPLPPGESFVLRIPLQYAGAGRPGAVRVVAGRAARLAAFLLLAAAAAALYASFRSRERALGRFASGPSPESIDARWLEANLFSLVPEEAGALWDGKIGAPEVAAVLARLAAEKKIETRVEGKNLVMRLLAAPEHLGGYEGELIQGLFFGGRRETDAEAIRKHYRSAGFDPAAKIRPGLEQRLAALGDEGDRPGGGPPVWAAPVLFLLGAGTLALSVVFGKEDPGTVIGIGFVNLVLWGIGAAFALLYRSRADRSEAFSLVFLWVPLLVLLFAWLGSRAADPASPALVAGVFLLRLAILFGVFAAAKTREGPKRIARRKALASARAFFARELSTPAPRLEDAWFPWIVAFGLTHEADRWSRSYGTAGAASASGSRSASSSGEPSSSPSSWTGGGGSFGGAGASASWAAAAGAVAAGVSAPGSSGGGGGGGGGGGSSGGGGGGGW